MNIDVLEDSLLQTNYPALRNALAQYLEQESSIKALKKSLQWGEKYQVIIYSYDYRVDGEIEREEFGLYDVSIDNRVVFKGTNNFPQRKCQLDSKSTME